MRHVYRDSGKYVLCFLIPEILLQEDILSKGKTYVFLHGIRYFDFPCRSSSSSETDLAEQAVGPVRTPEINVTKLFLLERLD